MFIVTSIRGPELTAIVSVLDIKDHWFLCLTRHIENTNLTDIN